MKNNYFKTISITLFFTTICFFAFTPRIKSILRYSSNFINTLTIIFSNLDKNTNERLLMKYPVTFSIANFIQEKTPENSTIIIPNGIPHKSPGHLISIPSNAYALMFPREIVSKKIFSGLSSNSDTYLIFLEGFPKEIVSYEKMWYVLGDRVFEYEELEGKNKIKEGIIKL